MPEALEVIRNLVAQLEKAGETPKIEIPAWMGIEVKKPAQRKRKQEEDEG
jgi:hypothetical protein